MAPDGTKIKANAGINKAMSYGRMKEAEPRLAAEVQRWLAQAAQTDKAEDRQLGASKRGDEMPEWMANKEKRLEKIRTAKAALEAEAKAKAASGRRRLRRRRQGRPGSKSKPVTAEPSDKAQRNFTDPDSRVMPTKNGFIQGYNAQAAVDGAHQIIVAHTLTNSPSDQAQLAPLLDAIKANLGKNPEEASADAGYCSQANLRTLIRVGSRASRHRTTKARHQGGHDKKEAQIRHAHRQNEHKAQARRLSKPVSIAKTDRRARLRPDQAGKRLPPVPPAQHRQGQSRMGYDLHRPQPRKTRSRTLRRNLSPPKKTASELASLDPKSITGTGS
jgi:hypothetical protein